MDIQQAIERLTPKLTDAIRDWWMAIDTDEESDVLEAIGFIGNNGFRLMAKAAMSVLEGSADVQEYLRKENLLESGSLGE